MKLMLGKYLVRSKLRLQQIVLPDGSLASLVCRVDATKSTETW